MRPGQIERRSHDYTRHGTTSLFAALDAATGCVIGTCFPRLRAAEFRRFLDEVEKNIPTDIEVHLVMDNYATHKAPLVRNWLLKRPHWHVHHTHTSSSWLNQVERFFAHLTERKIRRRCWARSSTTTLPRPSPSVGPHPGQRRAPLPAQ